MICPLFGGKDLMTEMFHTFFFRFFFFLFPLRPLSSVSHEAQKAQGVRTRFTARTPEFSVHVYRSVSFLFHLHSLKSYMLQLFNSNYNVYSFNSEEKWEFCARYDSVPLIAHIPLLNSLACLDTVWTYKGVPPQCANVAVNELSHSHTHTVTHEAPSCSYRSCSAPRALEKKKCFWMPDLNLVSQRGRMGYGILTARGPGPTLRLIRQHWPYRRQL